MIVWNGLGVFEFDKFVSEQMVSARILANLPDATTIIGGGDSLCCGNQIRI